VETVLPPCTAPHHPLLHEALVTGQAMLMKEAGTGGEQTHLCQEDVRVEAPGNTMHLHGLYDWGATETRGSKRRRADSHPVHHETDCGLGGECIELTCQYAVPVVNANDQVQTMKARGRPRS
jgi:hypothetical protein